VACVRRIIAGVSDSPRCLPALRCAADLAHAHDGVLFPVHAWVPSARSLAAHEYPSAELRQAWEDAAWQRLWHALDAAFGGPQPGLQVQPVVVPGNPGRILVRAASRADDLLVIGAGRRDAGRRRRGGTVSRYCLAYAGCPVIAVPPPALQPAGSSARAGFRRSPGRGQTTHP